MDSQLNAAALALSRGDALSALKRVALREDPGALALRGIAFAQLGELARARDLLRRAGRGFGPREPKARARCLLAAAEVALAARDLGTSGKLERDLTRARRALEQQGDLANAAHAYSVEARHSLLIGQIPAAERALDALDVLLRKLPHKLPMLEAIAALLRAQVAVRTLRCRAARLALDRAALAAHESRIAALAAEIETVRAALQVPAARIVLANGTEPLVLEQVETLLLSSALIVDACARVIRHREIVISLQRRPVLFALARLLAEAWPADVPRDQLVSGAFGIRFGNDSHRARLRVEIGRLRRALEGVATLRATNAGFRLEPSRAERVAVLAPPFDHEHAALLALLADGQAWSSSALALALGASQRTVQRALLELERTRATRSFGRGRARRWLIPPLSGITTTLLLPSPLGHG
ncbi:MAG TPA: helix-turn-helix domain-containing protein [Polyangiaceae bacterium]|nr:helix-turn-helix domain-containing protein [Polyangiaceae bacterium]